ncbi:MAG: hypothetical protein OEY67_09625 [Gammaproteobacteria bacterium]|nr:hypothetical protein [Gammaproteobacteria bacterium]
MGNNYSAITNDELREALAKMLIDKAEEAYSVKAYEDAIEYIKAIIWTRPEDPSGPKLMVKYSLSFIYSILAAPYIITLSANSEWSDESESIDDSESNNDIESNYETKSDDVTIILINMFKCLSNYPEKSIQELILNYIARNIFNASNIFTDKFQWEFELIINRALQAYLKEDMGTGSRPELREWVSKNSPKDKYSSLMQKKNASLSEEEALCALGYLLHKYDLYQIENLMQSFRTQDSETGHT